MAKRTATTSAWTLLCFTLAAACGSGGGDGTSMCADSCIDFAGTYELDGTCPATNCTVTQHACKIEVACDDGTMATGTASDGLRFSGSQSSCTGELQDGVVAGSCRTPDGMTCSFRTVKQVDLLCSNGEKPGASANDEGTLLCEQKAESDTDKDCVGMPGRPRKLDCEGEQTAAAEAAGCVRTDPTDSDVCCPTTVNGQVL